MSNLGDPALRSTPRREGIDSPAVTLHVYSPPLLSMGAYVVGEDGRLKRQAVPSSEELRPLASPTAG